MPFLDVFQFLSVARKTFPQYDFLPYKVDGFVQDILRLNPKFTQEKLNKALEDHLEEVKKFSDFRAADDFNFNPYTKIRHALYLSDKKTFAQILFDRQKETFDKWLNSHSIKEKNAKKQ